MMRRIWLSVPLLLASGCLGASGAIAAGGESMAASCNAQAVQRHIGQRFTPALAERIRARARARLLRTAPEGSPVTTDYNMQRLNIFYNSKRIITQIDCG